MPARVLIFHYVPAIFLGFPIWIYLGFPVESVYSRACGSESMGGGLQGSQVQVREPRSPSSSSKVGTPYGFRV